MLRLKHFKVNTDILKSMERLYYEGRKNRSSQGWTTLSAPSSRVQVFLTWVTVGFLSGGSLITHPTGKLDCHRDLSIFAEPQLALQFRDDGPTGETKLKKLQTDLGDITGLVPDHCSKANITIKQVTWIGFPVHIKVMFTLYYSLLGNSMMSEKKKSMYKI